MVRVTAQSSLTEPQVNAVAFLAAPEVNALDFDDFVTPEQTPKQESRRGWRRRRIRRGKS